MVRALKGKKGIWAKPGTQGSDPVAPGSYGGYLYMRSAPSPYPKTAQQRKVGSAGRRMTECKGKSGGDFRKCRHKIMMDVFGIPE